MPNPRDATRMGASRPQWASPGGSKLYDESIVQTLKWRAREFLLVATVLHLGIVSLSTLSFGQAWSGILDPSRAVSWSPGFTIPAYTVPCSTQPTLLAGNSNASANTTAIQNAMASCDATHNVINVPSGTYYVAGLTYPSQGHMVLRGAGASSTYIYLTARAGCIGAFSGVCMISNPATYAGNSLTLPGGAQECSWAGTNGVVGTYTQGATSIILNSCGGTPPVNQILTLDQANDMTDTSGIYVCDTTSTGKCNQKGNGAGNTNGRVVGGVDYSQQQYVMVTAVSGSGSGPYTVTISPGVYFNNIRSAQSPGAFWMGTVANDGIENLTIDHSTDTSTAYGLTMLNCYQCWIKNVRSMWALRDHVNINQSMSDVIRDSYFYQSQSHATESYGIEPQEGSAVLIENNIFQQLTSSVLFNQGSGFVVGYNYAIGGVSENYVETSETGHNAGSAMNLWEGNNFSGVWCDDTWGSSTVATVFRNQLVGWESGYSEQTSPIIANSYCRGENVVGNVLGQPSYHTQYQVYATSTTTVSGKGGVAGTSVSIYDLGTTDNGGLGVCTTTPACDTLTVSSLMRWGNYDVVNGAVQWNSTEASPASVQYINANFTSSYFTSLAHTLPNSLYLSSQPPFWRSMPWPPIGPDVSSGNAGLCTSGTYNGAEATSSSQCSGGSYTASSWAGHANVIPAQDCYLNVMNGAPDGSGGVLSFDASSCYTSQGGGPLPPQNLVGVVH
jgi:hypothetical protein